MARENRLRNCWINTTWTNLIMDKKGRKSQLFLKVCTGSAAVRSQTRIELNKERLTQAEMSGGG